MSCYIKKKNLAGFIKGEAFNFQMFSESLANFMGQCREEDVLTNE
jgi:hypothetical protein